MTYEKKSVKQWMTALHNKNWMIREEAVKALGDIDDPCVTQPLIHALGDIIWEVQKSAAEALGKRKDADAIHALMMVLGDLHNEVRIQAIGALHSIGEPAVIHLIRALTNSNSALREGAAEALGLIGDVRAVPPLLKRIEDEVWRVKWKAIWALGAIGDPQAVDVLIHMFGMSHGEIRYTTGKALAKIGLPGLQPYVNTLLRTYEHDHQTRQLLQTLFARIETVIFSQHEFTQFKKQTTAYNLDVSRCMLPMPSLKEIVIDADTYNFYEVERFLTYAVNYITQSYLKEHVHVSIYGDCQSLHPNLKNSVHHLCKGVDIDQQAF